MRHGRTAWNADGRFQGHTDVALDDRGRMQARNLGALLAPEIFARAVTSDLARARETAEVILAGREPPLECDARWREMRFGDWEGLTWPEIVHREPALAEGKATAPKSYTPNRGETFELVCARVADALASLDARADDGASILIVTHAGPLHALLRVVLGDDAATALGVRFSPAGVTQFVLEPTGSRVTELDRTVPDAGTARGSE